MSQYHTKWIPMVNTDVIWHKLIHLVDWFNIIHCQNHINMKSFRRGMICQSATFNSRFLRNVRMCQCILVDIFKIQHHVNPSTTEKDNCSYFSQNGGHSEWQLAFSVVADVTHQTGMVEIMLVHVIMSEMLAICST